MKRIKNEYELLLTPKGISFAPESEVIEILQNVLTICLTQKYSVPMDRAFGVEGEYLDEAVSKVRAKFKAEIVRAVKKFEPRARVTSIDSIADLNGRIVPRIRLRILD